MTDTWRATYSERFLVRAIQRPPHPSPAPVYRRLTDEEIAELPEQMRPGAIIGRAATDMLLKLREIGIDPRSNDNLARREWPHMPLRLARAYADEYVRTGQRP